MKLFCIIYCTTIFFVAASCNGTKVNCGNSDVVFVSKKSENRYRSFARNFEANLKGAVSALDSVDSAKIDVNIKSNVVKLRNELDQYSSRSSDILMTAVIRSNQAPCDKDLRNRVSALMDQMQLQSTEVEKFRLMVSRGIQTPEKGAKDSAIKTAVNEFKGTQEEIKSSLSPENSTVIYQTTNEWVVVCSGDRNLEESQYENNRLAKLGTTDNVILLREGSYRLITKSYATKADATIKAEELKTKYKDDVYVVNLKTWCPSKTNKGNYFLCN